MYVPTPFRLEDPAAIRRVLADFSFALLVTAEDGVPEATHLPFLHEPDPEPRGRLLGHFARANPQGRALAEAERRGQEVLAVFQGPHAYVSPSDYGPGPPAVPTWNYVAVHIYGVPRLIDDLDRVRALVTKLTARHEAGRAAPWSPESLDAGRVDGLLRAIQAFEIAITRIEAKAKLSQNRDPEQATRAAAALEAADDPFARETGRLMRAALEDRP
ncbi:MAG: FMN-binding negative transcriptional regulator [Kiloniellales bacterium]